jgi:hypothetical protein
MVYNASTQIYNICIARHLEKGTVKKRKDECDTPEAAYPYAKLMP